MSVFDKDGNPVVEDNPVTENFLEHLVGDGKKFTDPEALARGKYEGDNHVKNLERQLAEMREDMDKSAKLDELMELVKNQNKTVEPNDPVVDPSDTSSDQMTPEALKALIETHVNERDTATTRERNLAEADRMMTEKFGDSAGRVLSMRATEMGMSLEDIKGIASSNPKAFSQLVGLNESNKDTSVLLGGQRSEAVTINNGDTRNAAYYKDLRKKNKGRYYDPKIQMQMMKDAEAMGAAFYGNS